MVCPDSLHMDREPGFSRAAFTAQGKSASGGGLYSRGISVKDPPRRTLSEV